jgi:hypothetical protein
MTLLAVAAAATRASGEAARDDCRWKLVVPRTQGADGCWLDEHVTAQPGTLAVPCNGKDGEARAVFGDRSFAGPFTGGTVHLVLHTSFHFEDGCDWATTQTIDGRPRDGHLSYTYKEYPRPGQTGCANPCSATADVKIEPLR